jgi:LuxR family maltose regulon positive regulatory protein
MSSPILVTKLFTPTTRPELVPRPRLIEQLNRGLHRKLTLISAPAGFGKTTLVTEWLDSLRGDTQPDNPTKNKIAWLSLDESDNDPTRFLTYFIAALNQIKEIDVTFGEGSLTLLQSPQPATTDALLTPLINEIAAISGNLLYVLDDFHLVDAQPIQDTIRFLLENLPPQLHLVIVTREDPLLPLPRLRARGQLTELRAADLRFTSDEAAEFFNQVMGLNLSTENIAALETRTEGWIAGLQLAAISLQGNADPSKLIQSFTGSNRLILDYLIEEVLNQQPENVQNFLLQTAILDRLNGSLCDAVRFGKTKSTSSSDGTAVTEQENSQSILEMLDRANLFIVPLDDKRQWYRYHHLFADLLRQRLNQSAGSITDHERGDLAELHVRASQWYENNDLDIEAFQHAAAANDLDRAERLIEGDGLPLSFRGAVTPVLNWLKSLPAMVLDAKPSLWVTYAMTLLAIGKTEGIEEKLQAAEAANLGAELNNKTRDLIGRIADTRGTLAASFRQADRMIVQSRRALKHLHPNNLTFRTATIWKLGYAYEIQGDRTAALKAYSEAIPISQASGNVYINILATIGLGNIQLAENQLNLAVETFHKVLQLVGNLPIPVAWLAHLCLARIFYEWNDLEVARKHGDESLRLSRPIDHRDIIGACEAFLARMNLAKDDLASAIKILKDVGQPVHQHDFPHHAADVVAVQVLVLLLQKNLTAALNLAEKHEIPISKARVHLAQGDPSIALAVLEAFRQQVEAKNWQDELLKVMVLQAVVLHAHGDKQDAMTLIGEALALAEPEGFIRTFVDEGQPMERLLYEALSQGISPDYVQRLLAAFPDFDSEQTTSSQKQTSETEWIEPLSERELEVLQLISDGLTNKEIASRLYLSLNTIKAHTRTIYSKLGVNSRTKAVVRGKALGVLTSN